jgi:hypothetical protein
MTKRNQILIVILGLQILLAVYLFWPASKNSQGSSKALFPGIKAEEITELVIEDGEKKRIQMQRKNGEWVIPTYGEYPADQGKISSFLKKIVALETKPLVARKPSSHRRLKVSEDDYQRLINFKSGEKGIPQSLYLGTSPSYKKTHIRAGSGDEVYLARNFSVWEAGIEPSDWIDTLYFSADEKNIIRISIKNSHGAIDVVRGEQDEWILKGINPDATFNVEAWNNMLRKAVSIRMDKPLGRKEIPSFGLKAPQAVLTIITEVVSEPKDHAQKKGNGQESEPAKVQKIHTICIGARDKEEKGYVVKSSESPFFVCVPDYAVEPFVEKRTEDLIKKKEE